MWRSIIAAGLALAACAPTVPEPPKPSITLTNNAIAIDGGVLEIGFGRDRAGAVNAVSKLLGQQPNSDALVANCGSVISWPSGLALTFVNGDLRGWSAPAGRYATRGTVNSSPDGMVYSGKNCADGRDPIR